MKGKSLTLIGTALTLAITTNAAFAQSSKSPIAQSQSSSIDSPTEIKLSPEGKKILCEFFPLNSRCPGGTAINTGTPDSTKVMETKPAETGVTPDSTNVQVAPTLPESSNSGNTNTAPGNPILPESGNSGNLTPSPESTSLPASDNSGNTNSTSEKSTLPDLGNSGSSTEPSVSSPVQLPNSGWQKNP